VLGNRIVGFTGPNTTLSEIAKSIPTELRGRGYQTYLIDQQRWWQNEPLYIMEEMICYKHGSMVRSEMGITSRGETVEYMLETMVYSLYMMQLGEGASPEVEKFMVEQIYSIAEVYKQNLAIGNISRATAYLNKIHNHQPTYKYMMMLLNKHS
jgi:hypothetical protein